MVICLCYNADNLRYFKKSEAQNFSKLLLNLVFTVRQSCVLSYFPFATSSSILWNAVIYYPSSVLSMTVIYCFLWMPFGSLVKFMFSAFTLTTDNKILIFKKPSGAKSSSPACKK